MRCTRWFKILLLLFVPLNLFSQKKLSEFQVKIPKPEEAYVLSDSLGYLACIFQNSKEYEIDFLNPEYRVIGTAITQKMKSDKHQIIIGGVLNRQFCYTYFYNEKIKTFSALEINRSSGEAQYSRIQIVNKDEQFLSAFDMDGKFYILVVPKYTNTVRLLIMDGKNMEEKSFNAEMSSFYTALAKDNEDLSEPPYSEVGIQNIDYRLQNNIESASPSKKLYHYNGNIILTFDEPDMTHMVSFDVANDKSNYKKMNFSVERGNKSGQKQGNSFMLRNKFFRTTMSPDQFNITIIDLDSMDLLNTYNFFPNEDITILNSPLIQEGASSYASEEKEIKKTEQFFRRVLNGKLSIAANDGDSVSYHMEVGSYEIYTTYRNNPGSGFGSPSISFGVGMGIGMGTGIGVPIGMGSPGYYSNQPESRTKMVYFKSILNNEDFSHRQGPAPVSVSSRVNEYEYAIFRGDIPEVISINPYRKSTLLGYYIKNKKRFSLIDFPH